MRTVTGTLNRQQSLALLPKNCQVAQAESWRSWPAGGSEASLRDSQTGACVPQWFIYGGRREWSGGSLPHRDLGLTSTQLVGSSAGLLLILNRYQPGNSEWSQIRSWMAVFWISVESKETLRWGFRSVRWPPGEHSGAAMMSEGKTG